MAATVVATVVDVAVDGLSLSYDLEYRRAAQGAAVRRFDRVVVRRDDDGVLFLLDHAPLNTLSMPRERWMSGEDRLLAEIHPRKGRDQGRKCAKDAQFYLADE